MTPQATPRGKRDHISHVLKGDKPTRSVKLGFVHSHFQHFGAWQLDSEAEICSIEIQFVY